MTNETVITDLKQVTIRFSGDSGDGMQLTGTLFSTLSAIFGNEIATFPDYPAEIRAPQGTLNGVSGFQVRVGSKDVFNAGDKADVLVAMNPAALKVNRQHLKKGSIVIFDTDSFTRKDLEKALFKSEDPFNELDLGYVQPIPVPITSMTKESLADSGMENKDILRSKNMFSLGIVCWLFNRPIEIAEQLLRDKFKKRPKLVETNIKALTDGYNFGHNTHLTASTYRIDTVKTGKGLYTDINGNTATAYGLIAAAEKAGVQLFLGSYPITPATDILQELSARKNLGVKALQMEDEIAGICTAIGASFAGSLGATSTSGPGLSLKSEALGLAVMTELPLVVIDVQRGGPSTGMPTKSEQADLLQALYGRNGESPLVVIAATTPTDCFDSAYWASKIALEHMTPVILLTDGYIANGASTWKIPDLNEYPAITPPYVQKQFTGESEEWRPYLRDKESLVRYWSVPGTKGFMHRIGGLEKDYLTGVISSNPENHQLMVNTRKAKIEKIADFIPEQEVIGSSDADTLIVGWGGTYGHLLEAMMRIQDKGKRVALAHFRFISPLPRNTYDILKRYKKIIVAEQNTGHFASYLSGQFNDLKIDRFNRVEGQPFSVSELVNEFIKIIEEK
ncbi:MULTISPECIES: 2-oxoacid:acceptor oxidoreductase subunit alpha [Petrimonas]|jgi:2-oxoglutarate ferredoxin oxidoreductase subunit alpha|uniref:2-oxoglutarate oxidoreductase subunit KorA n=3 Tax=Petrimonas mucosa TaxID=1642646 RepID=A0A1G4G5W1_9BACT|nr:MULTISPECIES: 2-oxoacid:acceptor oxidoreductase subunit alpha [Petrimonas]MDD3560279.1 2-oxoacid:acceptor oxidoreductase subunit alpha [Petrimonas mucosa]SCM56812.1 2-oxoglutarate oxidoreductase subunit KorA [Petrimonas mucosa]SFU38172.1 2-oxoglutarate ferredoxin oxidoreductase subunit alpha [Porphyromonadaceae bacterium KHP3R9]HHT30704.1 2-oxoacid:acceptor oxidoreductase subunit alpha [Petrimonas mucosa]